MLDEKDLMAIANLIAASEERMGSKLDEAKQDIMQGVSVLMEAKFSPRFNLLAEGQQAIREQLPPAEDWEVLDTCVSPLEAMVRWGMQETAPWQWKCTTEKFGEPGAILSNVC